MAQDRDPHLDVGMQKGLDLPLGDKNAQRTVLDVLDDLVEMDLAVVVRSTVGILAIRIAELQADVALDPAANASRGDNRVQLQVGLNVGVGRRGSSLEKETVQRMNGRLHEAGGVVPENTMGVNFKIADEQHAE